MSRRRWISFLLIFFLPLALMAGLAGSIFGDQPTVVFLVRHAEKVDESADPDLSKAGNERAAALAKMLRDANIKSVHSTNYQRTKKTASPVATQGGIKVKTYDASDLAAFATQLKNAGGRHLVVGHSNTTPKLVQFLGGDPGKKIQSMEYDRLYIVTIDNEGTASTVLVRFGDAFVDKPDK